MPAFYSRRTNIRREERTNAAVWRPLPLGDESEGKVEGDGFHVGKNVGGVHGLQGGKGGTTYAREQFHASV